MNIMCLFLFCRMYVLLELYSLGMIKWFFFIICIVLGLWIFIKWFRNDIVYGLVVLIIDLVLIVNVFFWDVLSFIFYKLFNFLVLMYLVCVYIFVFWFWVVSVFSIIKCVLFI